MTDYELDGESGYISLNGFRKTVGVVNLDSITTNQTRTQPFNPDLIIEWAEAAKEAYGAEAQIVFTPDNPMVATSLEDDSTLGIAIAPRDYPDDGDDDD